MSSAFSRIEASKSAATMRMSDAFKNEAGAFDLPSILVGVVVVGVLTAGVLASIFGVIPFAQDKGAQQDIGAIATAEGVFKAQGGTVNGTTYEPGQTYGLNTQMLKDANLIGQDVNSVYVAGDSDSWAALSKSNSGQWFQATSKNSTPVKISAPTAGGEQAAAATANAAL